MVKSLFLNNFFRRHKDKLWWFHSSYSLLLGVGVMWLGTKNFTYLCLAVFHIAFIWLTSLALTARHFFATMKAP